MSIATVLVGFFVVYICLTVMLALIHGNYMEGLLVSSLFMIITIAGMTFYDHAQKNRKSVTSEFGTVEFTKKDPDQIEAPASTK